MRKLMVLAALLPTVASKRGLVPRVTLAAALAVTLLWMGPHEAQAGSFNPSMTVGVANVVADTPSDVTFHLEIPEGDVYFSTLIRFFPTGWQVTPSSDVDIGVQRSTQDVVFQPGLLNGACNTALSMSFNLANATTDESQTVTFEDALDDSNGDGNPDFIDMYPDFNDRIFGPAQAAVREAGVTNVSGVAIVNQSLFYEPGATIAGQALDPALGQPFVTLVDNMGDPEAVPMPSSLTDMCTRFDGTAVVFGTAEDGTVLTKNPKEAGTYTFYLLAVGLRDADGDGNENNLDPCPLTADLDWDPRASSAIGPGDADGDGLPSSCDPDDNDPVTDEDGDGFLNRQDNCPLVANGVADADNQGDSDFDGIGDACDPNPDDADSEGEAPEVLLSQDVTITEAPTPAVETPTPTVAPPATPVATPTPAVTPAPTPTLVIAPPPTGAGSASGGSWPWWPFALAGAAAAAAGALLAYQARRAKP